MIEELEDEFFTVETELAELKKIDLTSMDIESLRKARAQTQIFLGQIQFYRVILQNITK
jgi:hypothetical protein